MMTKIDPNKLVYYSKSTQEHLFNAIRLTLIKNGLEDRRILNEEGAIHAHVGDYLAYVLESKHPQKLLLEEVLGIEDDNPNVMRSHLLKTKTVCKFDLLYP